jgi:drug/metabolite transporter (DMT)-like permease
LKASAASSESRGVAIGCGLLFLHNLLNGWQDVYRASVFRTYDVSFITSVSFGLVSFFFYVTFIISRSNGVLSLPEVGLLNLVTTGSWGCVFAAFSLISPVIVVCIATGAAPLFTALMQKLIRREVRLEKTTVGVATLILVLTLLPVIVGGVTDPISSQRPSILAVGLGLAMAAALFDGATSLVAKRLYAKGTTTQEILGKRFVLLAVIATVVSIEQGTFEISAGRLGQPLIIALIGVVPAVYLLQRALLFLDPVLFEIVISTIPAFVLIFQAINSQFITNSITVLSTLLVVIVSALYGVREARRAAYV